jgi:hypothetical protein
VLHVVLAWLLVVLMWTALTIYALVKWIGSAPDTASATTVLLIVVGLVTGLALLLTLPIALVGRSMTPRRQKNRRKKDRKKGNTPDELVPTDAVATDAAP